MNLAEAVEALGGLVARAGGEGEEALDAVKEALADRGRREPLSYDELSRAFGQVRDAQRDGADKMTDDELMAYGFCPRLPEWLARFSAEFLEDYPAEYRAALDLLRVEVSTGALVVACAIGQALNNREMEAR